VTRIYGDKTTNVEAISFSLEYEKRVIKINDSTRAILAITPLAKDEDRRKMFTKNSQNDTKIILGI
jgi:hypothetical protein